MYKIICLLWIVTILGSVSAIDMQAMQKILANGKEISGIGLSACVTDWNSDGKKDLLVGEKIEPVFLADTLVGKIRVYLNTGTNSNPVFSNYTLLQADGITIGTLSS